MKDEIRYLAIILITLAFVIVLYFDIQIVSAEELATTQDLSASSWAKFKKDNFNSGYTDSAGPITNNTLWTWQTNSELYEAPTVSDGMVFVGTDDGHLLAFDEYTEDLIWYYYVSDSVTTPPTMSNGIAYFGTDNGILYAINITDHSKVFEFDTGIFYNTINTAPCVEYDKVFFGDTNPDDNCFWAINATTGEYIWHISFGPEGNEVLYSPAVYNGIVYIPVSNNPLFALNESDGALIWNTNADDYPGGFSSPTINNNMIYVVSDSDTLFVFNITNGELIWNTTINDMVNSGIEYSSTTYNDLVYVLSDNYLNVLNSTNGDYLWNMSIENPYPIPAISSNDMLYYAGYDEVHAIDINTREQIWNYNYTNTYDSIPPSLAIANENVYAAFPDGKVYAFGEAIDEEVPSTPVCEPCKCGSGGGGGGVSGTVTYCKFSNIFSVISNVIPGVIDINHKCTPVTKIVILTEREENNTEFTLNGNIKDINDKPAEKVYWYFNLNKPALIKEVKIYFKVDKEWLEEDDIVYLNRYSFKWDRLNTKFSFEDEAYKYYYATSPDTGTFAITATKSLEASVSGTHIEGIVNESEIYEESLITGGAVMLPLDVSGMPWWLILLLILIISLLVLFLLSRRKKRKPKKRTGKHAHKRKKAGRKK